MQEKRVLVTDYVHPSMQAKLEAMGFTVDYQPDYDPKNLREDLVGLHGIIINSKTKMLAEQIELSDQLEFIGRLGSGLEIIDQEAAEAKGIAVFNSPEGNRNAVAEHALGMLLALSNKLLVADQEVRSKVWERERNRGFEIEGKTVGIIGFGNTGEAFARKLSGWAQTVLYNDKYRLDYNKELTYIEDVSLTELMERADIISLHLPLTEETKYLVDRHFLDQCKDGLILINTSRGPIVKTEDLVEALESGKLSGACLDVFENEKPYTFTSKENQLYTRLYRLKNTVLSPHVAGWTDESLLKITDTLIKKLKGHYLT